MAPTKEELDRALNEIQATFLSREAKLAKAYAEHPDPDAWYLNFISCLAKVAAGPPVPPPSTTGHKEPAAGVGVGVEVEAEAEVTTEAANDSGGCGVTAGVRTRGIKRPSVQIEESGSNENSIGSGKEVRVIQPMSTGETEYRTAEGFLVSTTMPVTSRNRHPLNSPGLTTATGDVKVEVKREEEEMERRNETALMVQEEATTQDIQERLERPAQRRRLTRGIRPRKRILSSSSE